jgi:hypothetical protein
VIFVGDLLTPLHGHTMPAALSIFERTDWFIFYDVSARHANLDKLDNQCPQH